MFSSPFVVLLLLVEDSLDELLPCDADDFELLLVVEELLLPDVASLLLLVVELFTALFVDVLEFWRPVVPVFTFPLPLWLSLLLFTVPLSSLVGCVSRSVERFTLLFLLLPEEREDSC